MEPKYIAALEIGSSHIRAAVGSVDDSGILTLLAVEEENAVDVVRYGIIQNVDELSNRIRLLIRRLENHNVVSPRKIKSLYVSLGGRSMMTTSRQVVRQYNDETEITSKIVEQIKEEAKANGLSERTVVEVRPRGFVVDNLECYTPVGTFGKNIVADINLITCKPKILRNIEITLSKLQNISIKASYVRQLAIADLVLSADERQLGCMLVDFGAETTTVSVYKNGTLRYLATLPLGSRNITRDIMALQYTEERAEEIKRAIGDAVNAEPNYHKHDFDGDPIEVNNFIRARAGEIAVNIMEQAKYAGYTLTADLAGGIVLVGSGTKLKGFTDLLAKQSGVKARLGSIPNTIRISDPRLQGFEMIDIVALLNKVASENPEECMEAVVPVQPQVEIDPFDDGPGPQPIKEKEKKKAESVSEGAQSSFRLRLWDKLRRKADNLFNDDPDGE
ncbi:MAG: rod shape-determining protein [Lachnospiraceae bacterium]|nr:rod shape-determining protein [Lachnospiraceae bacterium]